ncbi:phage major capsid protein [Glaciecola sp. 2405UD65-10]|uniref:phage major capsid protein n=1 Tax=Glaciecola sp. 2405UD65-10 TaxID=3397244 RepID=UPI003B5A9F3E
MSIKNTKLTRFLDVSETKVSDTSRLVKLAFSSEQPIERVFDGREVLEVLDHSPESVDLSLLKDGAPLLVDHDVTDQVGVIENATIDNDRIGRVQTRFGKSVRASEVFEDVKDKIRRKVSVGYQILEYSIEAGAGRNGVDIYRVTKWRPLEVSIVSIPADNTVGVARNLINLKETKKMTDIQTQSARDKEANRCDELLKIGLNYHEAELAKQAIRSGDSTEDLRLAILAKRGNEEPIQAFELQSTDLHREKREYSIVNVIRSLAGDHGVDIGYERELNQEIQHKRGNKSKGFSIPIQALQKRAAVDAASIGQSLVETQYAPNMMVDFLRNKSAVVNSGATSIPVGQGGDLIIPRQTGTATATWLDLDGTDDITESNQTFDQVNLSMKTLTAMTTYTHRMLKQGLPDIEAIITNDLAALFATEIDKAALQGLASNPKSPTGILNLSDIGALTAAGGMPTFAELVEMEGVLADQNVDTSNLTYLTTPTIGTTLKTIEKATNTGQFIWTDNGQGDGMVNGYRSMYTKNMPGGNVLLGNFSDLLMAYWGSIDIEVDPYGDNFKKGNVAVRAMLDMDINVRRPESFCKLEVS